MCGKLSFIFQMKNLLLDVACDALSMWLSFADKTLCAGLQLMLIVD
jgi:hypothetical protein